MSNYQSSFHVIDVKLYIDHALKPQRPAAASKVAARCAALTAARCAVEAIGGV